MATVELGTPVAISEAEFGCLDAEKISKRAADVEIEVVSVIPIRKSA